MGPAPEQKQEPGNAGPSVWARLSRNARGAVGWRSPRYRSPGDAEESSGVASAAAPDEDRAYRIDRASPVTLLGPVPAKWIKMRNNEPELLGRPDRQAASTRQP